MIGDDRPRKHLFTFLNENQSISKKRTFKEIFSFWTDFETDLQDEDVSRSVAFVTMQLLISNCIIFKSCRKRNVRFFSWENGKWQEIKIFSMKMINYRKKKKIRFLCLIVNSFFVYLDKDESIQLDHVHTWPSWIFFDSRLFSLFSIERNSLPIWKRFVHVPSEIEESLGWRWIVQFAPG